MKKAILLTIILITTANSFAEGPQLSKNEFRRLIKIVKKEVKNTCSSNEKIVFKAVKYRIKELTTSAITFEAVFRGDVIYSIDVDRTEGKILGLIDWTNS